MVWSHLTPGRAAKQKSWRRIGGGNGNEGKVEDREGKKRRLKVVLEGWGGGVREKGMK